MKTGDLHFKLAQADIIEPIDGWWRETNILDTIFRAIEEADLWDVFHYYGPEDDPRRYELTSREDVLESTHNWNQGGYTLIGADEDVRFTFVLQPRRFSLSLVIPSSALGSIPGDPLEQLITLACSLHDLLEEEALLGPPFYVTLLGPDYPRPRPPRQNPRWARGCLINFVSKPYHQRHEIGEPNHLEILQTAELPDGATRDECDGLLILQWVDRLDNKKMIARRRAIQEQWMGETLGWALAPGFNEHGDKLHILHAREQHPPLTFYVEAWQRGYKATVLNPDGSVDEELFDEMDSWTTDGALPDGTPLRELYLILPDRSSAMDVYERATDIGVTSVLYATDDGQLWDPKPDVWWLDESSDEY